jgi:hypothetical protein
MKKGYKKADWYKPRCDEIFKLMKWENHKDHVGYDWLKEGIYLTDITKLQKNCKVSTMDGLESHESILKSPKMTVMQMRQKIEERMETPTLRVEERKPNEIQGTIELDVDMEGDCCSQLKEELMSEWVSTLDIVDFTLESDNKLDGWSYQEWVDAYADSLSSMSCEELVEDLENSKPAHNSKSYMSRLKPIIDAYHSCNFGADSSAKYAMLKQQERTFIIDSYEAEYTPEQVAQSKGKTLGLDEDYFMALTAKELGIDKDATLEEIEEKLLEALGDEVGWIQGYTWYEITADGKKRDWLNPKSDYDIL